MYLYVSHLSMEFTVEMFVFTSSVKSCTLCRQTCFFRQIGKRLWRSSFNTDLCVLCKIELNGVSFE